MRTIHALRHKKCVSLALFAVICAFVLAGCGPRRSTAGAAPTPSPIPTAGTVRGYGAAFGCPSDVVVRTAPAAANFTLRRGQGPTTITIQSGDVMEVQLPFGIAWRGPTTSAGVLELQYPSGYAWKPSNACIWRFVARRAGAVELTFFGTALCKKPTLCAPSEIISAFTIQVT